MIEWLRDPLRREIIAIFQTPFWYPKAITVWIAGSSNREHLILGYSTSEYGLDFYFRNLFVQYWSSIPQLDSELNLSIQLTDYLFLCPNDNSNSKSRIWHSLKGLLFRKWRYNLLGLVGLIFIPIPENSRHYLAKRVNSSCVTVCLAISVPIDLAYFVKYRT